MNQKREDLQLGLFGVLLLLHLVNKYAKYLGIPPKVWKMYSLLIFHLTLSLTFPYIQNRGVRGKEGRLNCLYYAHGTLEP